MENLSLSNWNPMKEDYMSQISAEDSDFEPNKLYVVGIHPNLTTNAVKNIFDSYAKVVHAITFPSKSSNGGKFGFFTFETKEEALKALRGVNRQTLGRFQFRIEFAKNRKSRKINSSENVFYKNVLKTLEENSFVGDDLDNLVADLNKSCLTEDLKLEFRNINSKKIKNDGQLEAGDATKAMNRKESLKVKSCDDKLPEGFKSNSFPFQISQLDEADFFVNLDDSIIKEFKNLNVGDRCSNIQSFSETFFIPNSILEVLVVAFEKQTKKLMIKSNEQKDCRTIGDMEKFLAEQLSINDQSMKSDDIFVGSLYVCFDLQEKYSYRRVLIENILSTTEFNIFYIDYGYVGKCSLNQLRPWKKAFASAPPLSIKCILELNGESCEWSSTTTEFIHEWVKESNYLVKAKICKLDGDCAHVELFKEDDMSLVDALSSFICGGETSLPQVVLPSTVFTITISHVECPQNFWFQLVDADFSSLYCQQISLKEDFDAAHNFKRSKNPKLNKFYVAKRYEDGMWYRIRLVKAESDKATVLCLDYGNTFQTKLENLFLLPDKYKKLPIRAINAALEGCQLASDANVVQVMRQQQNKPLLCKVVDNQAFYSLHKKLLIVYLNNDKKLTLNSLLLNMLSNQKAVSSYDNDLTADSLLQTKTSPIKNNFDSNNSSLYHLHDNVFNQTSAKNFQQLDVPLNQILKVKISNFTSAGFFDCHIVNKFMKQNSNLFHNQYKCMNHQMLANFTAETPCAVFHDVSSTWQRAFVVTKLSENVKITFIDIGTSARVNIDQLFQLPTQFASPYPPITVELADAEAVSGSWGPSFIPVCQFFESKILTGVFVGRNSQNILQIKLPDVLNRLIIEGFGLYSINKCNYQQEVDK